MKSKKKKSGPKLPEYKVKISKKAKYYSLKFTVQNGLEVIIPHDKPLEKKDIREMLHDGRFWIESTRKRIDHQRSELKKRNLFSLPRQINLRAIDRNFKVRYRKTSADTVTIQEKSGDELFVTGATKDDEQCAIAFRKWMSDLGREMLVPRLDKLSKRTRLPYKKAAIRGQKTRWGSCSSNGTISLNYKMLFLPPEVVQYVMIHELCHTVQMNHSKAFWELVEKFEKNYRDYEETLRIASRNMPLWL